MKEKEIISFCPKNANDWRQWLLDNHAKEPSVYLIFYKKSSAKFNLSWSEAVDQALCFGWIDSVKKTIDNESYMQFYSPRKAKSTWSAINKEKIKKLTKLDLMMPAGLAAINQAKNNGYWSLMDDVEKLIVPNDLHIALSQIPQAYSNFQKFTRSSKRSILYWIVIAKRPDTREKRIKITVEYAAKNLKPPSL